MRTDPEMPMVKIKLEPSQQKCRFHKLKGPGKALADEVHGGEVCGHWESD